VLRRPPRPPRPPRPLSGRRRWARKLATPVVSITSLGLLTTLAVHPELITRDTDAVRPAADSYPWYNQSAAEQLRQDQCLMSGVLRLGGPTMAATAQDGLNQPADKLHVLANRDHWDKTPLAGAYQKDRDAYHKQLDDLQSLRDAWQKPLSGLSTPAGFTETDFHWPPGSPGDGKQDFYTQTGLSKWISDRFWKDDADFYTDPTAKADDKTVEAFKKIGDPLYTGNPDPNLPPEARDRRYAEQSAYEFLKSGDQHFADDLRLFLTSGGFPRTAPDPDSPEYRVAVEDVKTRFAACSWRDPIDPDKVLGDVTSTAANEWQQEISSQAGMRNTILDANEDAVSSLTKAAKTLGDLLGQSWTADHLARWSDYWSPGGLGWVGDADNTVQVVNAQGKCLDVQGSGTANGTPAQVYTCNNSAAQRWKIHGSEDAAQLVNVASQKCLDVAGNNDDNKTPIRIWQCNDSPAQRWALNMQSDTEIKSVGTGKCLDLHTFNNGQNAWLYDCNGTGAQKFRVKPLGHNGTDDANYPDKAQFTKANTGINNARSKAKSLLDDLKALQKTAATAAKKSDDAETASYTVADQQGAPRGRGLLAGQQKNQVTQGITAAVNAMEKAGETAEAATRASGSDSDTIAQRALAQAAQVKTEFRRQAAHTAELQAKAAADAAKVQRDNAKADADTAKQKLGETLAAEDKAKTAAATAHARRLDAEAEEATAKQEKANAAAHQADANKFKLAAQDEAGKAKDAKGKAEASEKTAEDKRDDAKAKADHARDMRDDAWDARQKANVDRTKADAKKAYADSLDAGDDADKARQAANDADKHATDSENAAKSAQSDADAATQAAQDADAAATRAEAAAKRARADSDAAQAAKADADKAVRTATASTADAIAYSQKAAGDARAAVRLADQAENDAKTANDQAEAAKKDLKTALVAAAKSAGYAYVTAQAAVDADKSAKQVVKPANDAIELGSPYIDNDSTAELVVLTGQASMTLADQQKTVADTHAKNAQAEADAAKNIADQAKDDTKAALQSAANAAQAAADARGYANQALDYSADAAKSAAAAVDSLNRTKEYDRQAGEDAAAADTAATNAEGYAKDARTSADEAALDADAAHKAADQAAQDAKDARAAANRADAAATEAEQHAKDADKYAKETQDIATETEKKQADQELGKGSMTGVSGVFVVPEDGTFQVLSGTQQGNCVPGMPQAAIVGCDATYSNVHVSYVADFYLCTDDNAAATAEGCPQTAWRLLERKPLKDVVIKNWQHHFSGEDVVRAGWQNLFGEVPGNVLFDFLAKDMLKCLHGSVAGCAWAYAAYGGADSALGEIAKEVLDLNRAVKSEDGIADAWKSLKESGLDDDVIAGIGKKEADEIAAACRKNSFPAGTQVLMADGSRKAIDTITTDDRLLATDPQTGETRPEPVTDTFSHRADQLVAITFADGGRVLTTPGHRMYVTGHGWTIVSELAAGDRLRTPDGKTDIVAGLRTLTAPQTVWDLTVDDLHTFYVLAGAKPVLVHNCEGELSDALYDEIDARYGLDIADGVEYNAMRMHDGTVQSLDHEIPGIGHNLKLLADYLASWRNKFTYRDVRQGSQVVYDAGKGVLVVKTPRNIHAYQYTADQWEKGVHEGRYVPVPAGGTP
jgi:hypothetical protein